MIGFRASKNKVKSLRNKVIDIIISVRYQVLTLPEEDAANCLFVNGTLIHIDSCEASDSAKVRKFQLKIIS